MGLIQTFRALTHSVTLTRELDVGCSRQVLL